MAIENEKRIIERITESIERTRRAREAAEGERIQRESPEPVETPRHFPLTPPSSLPRIERQR